MPEVRMTSMAEALRAAPPMTDVRAAFIARFRSEFGYPDATVVEACRA
jgi:hypothetical protein